MIKAALDCRTAYPALCVADCSEEIPRCLFAGSIQVGVNIKRTANDAPGPDLIRVVSDYQIEEAVNLVLDKLAAWAVTSIVVDEAPAHKPFMVKFVALLLENTAVETNLCKFPRAGGSKSVPQCFGDWPEAQSKVMHADGWRTGDYAGTRDAGRMLLGDVPAVRMPARVTVTRLMPLDEIHTTIGEVPPRPVFSLVGTDSGRTSSGRPRILAIDTGAHVGVCVAEERGGGRFARVVSRTITVDPTDVEERHDFVDGLAQLIRDERVETVVIERVEGVHGADRGTGPGALAALRAMATRLVQAAWLGGMVECLAFARPGGALTVKTASAANWRRQIIGGQGTPDDSAVALRVREAFPEWPDRTTEHERDAAGLVVWACRDLTPKARKRGAAKPSGRKAGCICPPRHKGAHLGWCPLRKARARGTVQMCKACGAPRKGHTCPAKLTANV